MFISKSPRKVIEAVLKRDLRWFDYDKLDEDKKLRYYAEIQHVIHNDSFQNEVKHILTDWVEEIAKSDNDTNRDKILRYSINGLEVLLERLGEIYDPRANKPTTNDVNSDV